jgi:hypothetical protein
LTHSFSAALPKRSLVEAVAYLRTSSAANVGRDKDSDKRQRATIEAFAKRRAGRATPSVTPNWSPWSVNCVARGRRAVNAHCVTFQPSFLSVAS